MNDIIAWKNSRRLRDMSYSHYWRRSPELDMAAFAKAAADTLVIVQAVRDQGIALAGPTGEGAPEVTAHTIAFNGAVECGHAYLDGGLGHSWPTFASQRAMGGALLDKRACGGCCKAEEFFIDRLFLARSWDRLENHTFFQYCCTDYRPYDLAVTATLIRLKEHLGDKIVLSSDGKEAGFEEAKRLCRELFGWSSHFALAPLADL